MGSQYRCDHSPLVRGVPELGEVDACPTHVDQPGILTLPPRDGDLLGGRTDGGVTLVHPPRIIVTVRKAGGVGSIPVRDRPSTHLARYPD